MESSTSKKLNFTIIWMIIKSLKKLNNNRKYEYLLLTSHFNSLIINFNFSFKLFFWRTGL